MFKKQGPYFFHNRRDVTFRATKQTELIQDCDSRRAPRSMFISQQRAQVQRVVYKIFKFEFFVTHKGAQFNFIRHSISDYAMRAGIHWHSQFIL